jgi:hypothetical protein
VQIIRENLKTTQSRQKSYADNRRELTFEVGDFVYLKVSPMRGMRRFKVKGNSSLYQFIQDLRKERRSSISVGTTRPFIECAKSV